LHWGFCLFFSSSMGGGEREREREVGEVRPCDLCEQEGQSNMSIYRHTHAQRGEVREIIVEKCS